MLAEEVRRGVSRYRLYGMLGRVLVRMHDCMKLRIARACARARGLARALEEFANRAHALARAH